MSTSIRSLAIVPSEDQQYLEHYLGQVVDESISTLAVRAKLLHAVIGANATLDTVANLNPGTLRVRLKAKQLN
ncbi:hypothetical protein EVAR_74966_1 [Eumeta japonica]|uniref:Uncharacterized protein n=1 Tax=Eumeta variegata TaxID=151549 RepID=A0A4C1UI90_EUMVA|nr:hypothetical protein EVAR_74966_1 [Eumeta japonica]